MPDDDDSFDNIWLDRLRDELLRESHEEAESRDDSEMQTDPASDANRMPPQANPETDLEIGVCLGPYEILDKLGQGGMGAVYRARHQHLDKIVALKVLSPEHMGRPDAVKRFQREMKAVGQIEHPHLVRALDAGETNGFHFLVMEYLDGLDLEELIRREGPLDLSTACELIRQAALGLEAAHQRDMIHRDLKPANLMLTRQPLGPPIVKVLDLGLARVMTAISEETSELTGPKQIMGTLDYMAPEQAEETRTVDVRADIFSLGATLFKLLTDRMLFDGPNHVTVLQKLHALANEAIPDIRMHRPDLPGPFRRVLFRMMMKDRGKRYTDPFEVAEALEPFADADRLQSLLDDSCTVSDASPQPTSAAGVISTESYPTLGRIPVVQRRSTWLMVAGILAILFGIGVLLWSPEQEDDNDPAPSQDSLTKEMTPGRKESSSTPNSFDSEVITPDDGWIDVLPWVDFNYDVPREPVDGGDWQRESAGLRSPEQEFARVRLPIAARAGYQIRVEFTRVSGTDAVDLYLPVATRQVLFVIDGFGGKGLSGLQAVKRQNLPIPGDTGVGDFHLENGVKYTFDATVTAEGNEATISARLGGQGEFQMEWTGPIGDLSLIDHRFTLGDTRVFGLAAWNSEVLFSRFRFRALTRDAKWTRVPKTTKNPD